MFSATVNALSQSFFSKLFNHLKILNGDIPLDLRFELQHFSILL